jgi:hypothetical protein
MGELDFCKLISHAAAAESVGAIGDFYFMLNCWGVKLFGRHNSSITIFKLIIPAALVLGLIWPITLGIAFSVKPVRRPGRDLKATCGLSAYLPGMALILWIGSKEFVGRGFIAWRP